MRIVYVLLMMLVLLSALTFTTQSCGFGEKPFVHENGCSAILKPSICLDIRDTDGKEVFDSQMEVYATFNGEAETKQSMLSPPCLSTLPSPKGAVSYELRIVTKGKEYKKTVEVKFDGCHPITETVKLIVD